MDLALVKPLRETSSGHEPAKRLSRNVGDSERAVSLASGAILVLGGIARGRTSGLTLAALGGAMLYRGFTGNCRLYSALGLSTVDHSPDAAISRGTGVKVEESITILRPREELYAYWRKLENLPQIMRHLVSVSSESPTRSHWVAKGPLGNVEWDADLITETPNELLSWRSTPESSLATAGSVHFKEVPKDRGVEIRVEVSYSPLGGQWSDAIAKLFMKDPESEIREDLRTFKRFMETGTIPTTAGQPRGRCRS